MKQGERETGQKLGFEMRTTLNEVQNAIDVLGTFKELKKE